ncbi:cytochrome c oxidase subunit 2 [Tanacetum coccineum]
MMQGIIDLQPDIFFFLILILVFISWILVRALWHFQKDKNPIPQRIVHGTTIEILQTIFPSIIPMFIAIPSFALLYSMDELVWYFQQENKKGRNKSGEKGKWNSSQRQGTQGGSTNKLEKGSKEGTHLDRATTEDRI